MLNHHEAMKLLAAGEAAARAIDVPMSLAVMDAAGHLLAFSRMDGTPWVTGYVAQGKAWTAAAYGTSSGAQKSRLVDMPNFSTAITALTQGRFTPQTGAVPVFRAGQLLGSLGASGGTGEQDEAVCMDAVASVGLSTTR